MSDDVCLIHGSPMRYDFRSGLELCPLCETEEELRKSLIPATEETQPAHDPNQS